MLVAVVVVSVVVVDAVEVESVVMDVVAVSVVVGAPPCAGREMITVRAAVPVRPFWSTAMYSIVEVPAVAVSMWIWSSVVVAPPFTIALMPRFRSAVGPLIMAPKSP